MNETSGRPQDFRSRREIFEVESDSGGEDAVGAGNLAHYKPRSRPSGEGPAAAPHVLPLHGEVEGDELPPKNGRAGANFKKCLLGLALVAALIGAGVALQRYVAVGRFIYTTDDAYVRTDLAIVSPKISGYVEEVGVVDNQHVKLGQLLARIDAGDYRLALSAARQKVATQNATIARIEAQAEAQKAVVAQVEAQLASARAERTRAEADLTRIRALTAADFATRQRMDQSVADRDKAAAAVAGAEAALSGAKANLVVLQSQTEEAARMRAELVTMAERAERDLGFTEIKAPFDGIVGNRVVEPGQFAQPGARLMALAPDDRYYVEANFKETQLDRLAPGQTAKVRIDAYGDEVLDGVVESIAPASGAQYALLPPENATGNFTKITQRFPVRIRLASAPGRSFLRAGLSVVVDVDTRGPDAAK